MQFLTVSTSFYCIHHNILCCHERKFRHQTFFNYFRIYNQSVNDIQTQIQNTVNCEKTFRYTQALIRRVIQSTFKPLRSRSDRRIQCINHHVTGQRCDSFTSHWISLVCHCRRSDLCLFKRLFHFFQMLEKTDVIGEFVCTCCNSGKYIHNSCIHFTGIGLSGYRIACFKSHLLSNHWIDLINGLLISFKQFQETCLCTGCSL